MAYRSSSAAESGPPDVAADALGAIRSAHVPPSLASALLGPLAISAVVFATGRWLAGTPLVVTLLATAAVFATLAIVPFRTRGYRVLLHERGVHVAGPAVDAKVAFDDVNEVWLEIPRLHSEQGAHLRAMRLVDFDGRRVWVPLTLDGGARLAQTIVRECSTPLWSDARKALAEGKSLTFGDEVVIDRDAVTLRGVRAEWQGIRLVRLQSARVAFFRSRPLLPWRTVGLGTIPNPTIFSALVAQCAREVVRDDVLVMEHATPGDARKSPAPRSAALRAMLVGAALLGLGLGISWWTHATRASVQVVAFGPILFGAVRLVQGFLALGARDD